MNFTDNEKKKQGEFTNIDLSLKNESSKSNFPANSNNQLDTPLEETVQGHYNRSKMFFQEMQTKLPQRVNSSDSLEYNGSSIFGIGNKESSDRVNKIEEQNEKFSYSPNVESKQGTLLKAADSQETNPLQMKSIEKTTGQSNQSKQPQLQKSFSSTSNSSSSSEKENKIQPQKKIQARQPLKKTSCSSPLKSYKNVLELNKQDSNNQDQKMKRIKPSLRNTQDMDQSCQRTSGQNPKQRFSSRRQVLTSKQIWAKKVFLIIMLVNRLLFKLKKVLVFSRPWLLNTQQLNLINDKGAREVGIGWGSSDTQIREIQKGLVGIGDHCLIKYQKLFKKALKKRHKWIFEYSNEFHQFIRKISKLIPVFNLMSKWILIWEVLIFLITSFNLILIPLDYSFTVLNPQFDQIYFHLICPIVFFTDILIRFNTSFFQRGCLVNERSSVIFNYCSNQFIPDLITSLSLSYKLFSFNGTYLIFFIRIFYFSKIIDKLMESVMLNSKLSGSLKLFVLLTQVQFLCHIFTCVWHALGKYTLDKGDNGWMNNKSLIGGNYIYLDSYYFCIITMTTTGFGDVTPVSIAEKIFVSGMSVVSSIVMGYSINSIGNILGDMKKQREVLQQRIAGVNEYMRKHNVNLNLQSKTIKYLEYVSSEGVDKQQKPDQNLDQVSKFLKEEILKDVYVRSINLIPFFRDNFSQPFKERLSLLMSEQIYGPDEIIAKKGRREIPRIQIIIKGEVELFWEIGKNVQQEKKLKNLKEGSAFGFIEFFSCEYSTYISAKSIGVSRVQQIKLDDLYNLLEEFEEEKEIFSYMRDSVQLHKEYDRIYAPCYSCGKYSHITNECPFLFYDQHKEQIIKAYNKSIHEIQKTFTRSYSQYKYPTLMRATVLNEDIVQFRKDFVQNDETNEDFTISEEDQEEEEQEEEHIHEDTHFSMTKVKSEQRSKKGSDIKEVEKQKKLEQEKKGFEEDQEEDIKTSTQKFKMRSLSMKNMTSTSQNPSHHRASLQVEDVSQFNTQSQQKGRISLLIPMTDEKVGTSSQLSFNRFPTLTSKNNMNSVMDVMTQNFQKGRDRSHSKMHETATSNTDGQEKSKNKFDPVALINNLFMLHQQQNQTEKVQTKMEDINFDKVCTFRVYFPHCNIKNVIEELERMKRKARHRQSQKQRRTGLNKGLITLKQLHTLKTMFADKYAEEELSPRKQQGELLDGEKEKLNEILLPSQNMLQ